MAEKDTYERMPQILVRMPQEIIDAIDELRRQEKDLPSRPEMIRRIIEERLERNAADGDQ